MSRPFLLPLHWYVRPILLLAGACVGTAAVALHGMADGAAFHPPLLMIQATAGDPDAREDAVGAAMTQSERIATAAKPRRLSREEIDALLRREGVTLPSGVLPLPPIIEAYPSTEAEARQLTAALAGIAGIVTDRSPPAPSRANPIGSLLAVSTAILLGVAGWSERRARAGTVRLLEQLGVQRLVAFAHPLAAAGGSLLIGLALGVAFALMLGWSA